MNTSDIHLDSIKILKGRPDKSHTLFCNTCEYVCNSKRGSITLTLRNRSEVQRTRKHRSTVEPVFIHVFIRCRGTVQPLEQLSLAAGGQRERQPVQWQLELLWHIQQRFRLSGWERKKSRKTLPQNLIGSSLISLPCLLLCALPLFSLIHLIQASLTLIRSCPCTHREQALTHAAEISISRCCCCCCNPCAFVIECMCVCVYKKGRERVGWWVDGWVDMAKGGRRRRRRRRRSEG